MNSSIRKFIVALSFTLVLAFGTGAAFALTSTETTNNGANVQVASAEATPQVLMADTGVTYNGYPVQRGVGDADCSISEFYFSDGYFKDEATTYNEHLATFAMVLANASSNYYNPSGVTTILNKLGCTSIEISSDWVNSKTVENAKPYLLATKTLFAGTSEETTLVIAMPRSGSASEEWSRNMLIGETGDGNDMSGVATAIKTATANYLTTHSINASKVKIFTCGFSRGAGIANLLAGYLSDTYGKANVYAYCIETPMMSVSSSASSYTNIHVVDNYNDLVTYVAPSYLGFSSVGADNTYANSTLSTFKTEEANMLKQLALICAEDAEEYQSISDFKWKKIELSISKLMELAELAQNEGDLSLDSILTDSSATADGSSPSELYSLVSSRLQDAGIKTRTEYTTTIPDDVKAAGTAIGAKETYTCEDAIRYSVYLGFSLTDDQLDALVENFKNFPLSDLSVYATLVKLYNYMDSGSLWYMFKSFTYAQLIEEVWDLLDSDNGDYKKISSFLTAEQTEICKGALPIGIWYGSRYYRADKDQEKQTLGTLLYNIPKSLIEQHLPTTVLAYLRANDSYYANATSIPAYFTDSVYTNIVMTNGSSTKDLNVSITNATGTEVASVTAGVPTIKDGSIMNVYVYGSAIAIETSSAGLSQYTVSVSSASATETEGSSFVITRAVTPGVTAASKLYAMGQSSLVSSASCKLYHDQTVSIAVSNASVNVTKTIVASSKVVKNGTSLEPSDVASYLTALNIKGGTPEIACYQSTMNLIATNLDTYCKTALTLNGEATTETTFTRSNTLESPNFIAELTLTSHNLEFKEEVAADYENDGCSAHWECSNEGCGKCFADVKGSAGSEVTKESLVIEKLKKQEVTVSVSNSSLIYTGKTLNPTISVTAYDEAQGKNITLTEGTDFNFTGTTSASEVGVYSFGITVLKAQYKEVIGTYEWSIVASQLDVDVTFTNSKLSFTGSTLKPAYTVTAYDSASAQTVTLKEGTDYSVSGTASAKYPGTYSFTINILDTNKYNAVSDTFSWSIALDKVTGLKASNITTTTLKLTWTKAAKGVSGYYVYKNGSFYKKVSGYSTNYCTVTKLTAGSSYYFRVVPYININSKATTYTSTSSVTIYQPTCPSKVTISKVTTGTSHYLKATWGKVTCTGYYVVIAKNSSFTSGKVAAKTTSLYKTFTKLTKGKRYYVKVCAYKTYKGVTVYGSYSSVKYITIK